MILRKLSPHRFHVGLMVAGIFILLFTTASKFHSEETQGALVQTCTHSIDNVSRFILLCRYFNQTIQNKETHQTNGRVTLKRL